MTTITKAAAKTQFALWLTLFAALVPWFFIRIQQATNSDILWLCEALHRYFSGCRLTDCAFENNPPLSMLLYTLPVLSQDWLGLPIHYTVFLQTFSILLVCTWAIYKIVAAWDVLQSTDIYFIVAAYLLANTIGSSLYFGERDHLVGMALVPFVLMQLTLTFNLKQADKLKWPVFLLGSIFILVKPHHGLLPTILLLHRAFQRCNLFSILRDADFISLAAMTPLYMGFVALVFPDYVQLVLPDIFTLYITKANPALTIKFILTASSLCLMAAVAAIFVPINPPAKRLIYFFLIAAMVSLIPYYVQGMGFYYHVMPVISFMWPAIALVILHCLESRARRGIAAFLTTLFIIIYAYTYSPLNLGYPHHKDYANMPMTKLLEKNCPEGRQCSFFMFNRDMGIINETAYYTGMTHASRFGSMWWLPTIINARSDFEKGMPSPLDRQQLTYYTKKYTDMIAEDMARYKPETVIVWRPGKDLSHFNFIKFCLENPAFAKEWHHYTKGQPIELSYREYFRGAATEKDALSYDVYRRDSP